jgi:hypothetical protein
MTFSLRGFTISLLANHPLFLFFALPFDHRRRCSPP